MILPQNPNPSKTVSGDKIYYQDENGCFLEAQVIESDPIRMKMRLYDGKEYFTRSVGDLLTNVMPEPPAKKRKTTRGRNQQPSSTTCETQINQQVDDGGSKPYMCAITPEGVMTFCGEFYSVRKFSSSIFLLSKIVEINTNFICTMVLCKANEKGLLCQTEGLELNVDCSHVMKCSSSLISSKTLCKQLIVKQKEIRHATFIAVKDCLEASPPVSCYSKNTRRFQLATKIREELGKSFSSKGFKVNLKLGLIDLVHDPGLLGLNFKQGVHKREFDLISTGFGELDLLLGKGWDYKFHSSQDPSHFYFVVSLSFQVFYQSAPTLQVSIKYSFAPFTWCQNYRTRCREYVVKKRSEGECS